MHPLRPTFTSASRRFVLAAACLAAIAPAAQAQAPASDKPVRLIVPLIRAAALLLRHALQRPDLAQRVEHAVDAALAAGWRTADIAQLGTPPALRVGTRGMGDAVVRHLLSNK